MASNEIISSPIIPLTFKNYEASTGFIMGIPGAGEGDYLRDLCKGLEGYQGALNGHLSLRQLQEHVSRTTPAEPSAIISILKIKMQIEAANGKTSFLIDGFPRDMRAAFLADAELTPKFVLYFDCPEDVAMQRFISRKRGEATEEKFKERVTRLRPNLAQVIDHYKHTKEVAFVQVDTNCLEEESKEKILRLFSIRI